MASSTSAPALATALALVPPPTSWDAATVLQCCRSIRNLDQGLHGSRQSASPHPSSTPTRSRRARGSTRRMRSTSVRHRRPIRQTPRNSTLLWSQRGRRIMVTAQRRLRDFQKWNARSYLPREATRVMQNLKGELPRPSTVQAVKDANFLAKAYPFCVRAHLLRGYALLEQAASLPPSLNKKPILDRTLDTITQAASTFEHSLLIALFRAKLLFQLERKEEAAEECARAINIRTPTDPGKENVLRIAVDVDRKSRVASVKDELTMVLDHIHPGSTATMSQDDDSDEENDDSDEEPVNHQSTMYSYSAAAYETFKPSGSLEQPQAEQIHFVAGEVVPQETVNVFALHCKARSKCSRMKTVCQVCSFEKGYDARIISSEMAWHYKDKHVNKVKQQDDAQVPPQDLKPALESITCSEKDCKVMTRTTKDMRLHYYFVHRLPADWWIT